MAVDKQTATVMVSENKNYDVFDSEAANKLYDIGNVEAITLWHFLASRPGSWEVNQRHVSAKFGIGRDRYRRAMRILQEIGLASLEHVRDGGRIVGSRWHIRNYLPTEQKPAPSVEGFQPTEQKSVPSAEGTDFQATGNPVAGNPVAGNKAVLTNTDQLPNSSHKRNSGEEAKLITPTPICNASSDSLTEFLDLYPKPPNSKSIVCTQWFKDREGGSYDSRPTEIMALLDRQLNECAMFDPPRFSPSPDKYLEDEKMFDKIVPRGDNTAHFQMKMPN